MLCRRVLCTVVTCVFFSSDAVAQDGNGSAKVDQELAEISQTLTEMSKVLSQMAVTLDRIDDTLKRRQAEAEMPAAVSNEEPVTPPVLFPPNVERAMIREGQMYRRIDPLQGPQDPSYRLPRSILEPSPRAKPEIYRPMNRR